MTWTRAIARITVGGEDGYRGTGALVSASGLVLTAFHVVADHERSVLEHRPLFHDLPIQISFGDPKQGDEQVWQWGEGSARIERYSIEDDWALLRLPGGAAARAAALPLAKLTTEGARFTTFGFPKHEATIGGQYHGTVGALQPKKVELLADNLPTTGVKMGGISGAPCLVGGNVVGVIVQSLANELDEAIKPSLYMVPIERVVRSVAGLLAWDDGTDLPFQRAVQSCIKTADLEYAGELLGVPAPRGERIVARRVLHEDVVAVAEAFQESQLDPRHARPLLDYVGSMAVHADAVDRLQEARQRALTPLLTCTRKKVHAWYLRRAFGAGPPKENRFDPNTLVVLRLRSGEEELPVITIEERVREDLKKRVSSDLVEALLSSTPPTDEEQARLRCFWLILVGESRYEMVTELHTRFPNASVVLASSEPISVPEIHREHFLPVFPAVDEEVLLERWGKSASLLQVPPEPQDDDT